MEHLIGEVLGMMVFLVFALFRAKVRRNFIGGTLDLVMFLYLYRYGAENLETTPTHERPSKARRGWR